MTHLGEIAPRLVVTGAGISMGAGLPSGPALVESALKKLGKSVKIPSELITKISRKLPLEVFFQVVADHAGQTTATRVTKALNAEEPTVVHNWIADRVKDGQVTRIYTFNFDTLHECALGVELTRSTSGRSVILESNTSDFRLTKLHGSSDAQGVISIGEYVQGFSDPVRRRLLEDWSDQAVLVLGYGGWDADLAVTLDEAISTNRLPNQVTWVDLSFPERGGRTTLLSELESAGVACKRVTGDLHSVLSLDNVIKERQRFTQFDYSWREFEALSGSTTSAIIAESAMLAGEVGLAARYVEGLSGHDRLRLEALLLERQDSQQAIFLYDQLVHECANATSAALAAARIHTLSRWKDDCFDSVSLAELDPGIAQHFSAYIESRRTDLGGLDRPVAAARARGLPRPHETAQGVDSLDAVRLFVSLLTESARVLHEARDYESALALDKRAYRFASALGDPALSASVSGGVGACLMGIADSLNGEEAVSARKDAVRWLTATVGLGRAQVGDYTWGLHMCNLGSTVSILGEPEKGIGLIREGLPVLQEIMPNWAVSAWAYLAGAYGDLFQKTGREENILLGLRALINGWELVHTIRDQDDAYLLLAEKRRLDSLLPDDTWSANARTQGASNQRLHADETL